MDTVHHTSENEPVRETSAFHRENKSSSLDRDDLNMNLMRLSTGVKVFPPCFLFTSLYRLKIVHLKIRFISLLFHIAIYIINVDRFIYNVQFVIIFLSFYD